MKLFKVILIICAFLTLTACNFTMAPVKSFNERSLIREVDEIPELTQLYKASYEKVWEATLITVQEIGNPLQIIDKKKSFLIVDWTPFYDGLLDCFIIHVSEQEGNQIEVSIKRVVQSVTDKDAMPTNGKAEAWIFSQIKQELK